MNNVALRYFLEVARCGSIAAATERLHVAGSAVSRQIAGLEHELGTPLFERQPRGMVLTDAGQHLATYAQRSRLEEERIKAIIRTRGANNVGMVRIAASQGLAAGLIPKIARQYRQEYTNVFFSVGARSPTEIVSAIREGDVDIGLAYASGQHPDVTTVHRFRVRTHAVMSLTHPLASRNEVALREAASFPIATSPNSTIRHMLTQRATVDGLELNVVFESDYSDGLFEFCSSGDAITFASSHSVSNWVHRGLLVAVPLKNPQLFERNVEVQVMEHRILPSHIDEFIRFLARYLMQATESQRPEATEAL